MAIISRKIYTSLGRYDYKCSEIYQDIEMSEKINFVYVTECTTLVESVVVAFEFIT